MMYKEQIVERIVQSAINKAHLENWHYLPGAYHNLIIICDWCPEQLVKDVFNFTGVCPMIYPENSGLLSIYIHIPSQHEPRL